jgi:hypothetical protein
MHLSSCVAVLAAALLPLSAQDEAAAGFELAPAVFPGTAPFAVMTALSGGETLAFDGTELNLFAPDGTLLRLVSWLPASTFPSFVVVDPTELVAYFGESSAGGVYEAALAVSAAPNLLASLVFPYDAAVDASGAVFVSAATCGFGCGNEVWRIDVGSLAVRLVASVPGASGPLVFDDAGWLYYGTATSAFPSPPAPSAVHRWSAAQLAGPQVLDLDDAQLIGDSFVGASRFAFDSRTDALYLLENNFATGENRIVRVLGSAAASPVVVEGRPFNSMSNLVLVPGSGTPVLRAFQPASDALIGYTTSDFVAPIERVVVRPRRPVTSLAGPGLSGPGTVDLTLVGGPPHGFARLLYGPSALYSPIEHVLQLNGLPLFVGLHPGTLASLPGVAPLDASGGLQQSFVNPGGLEGQVALQLLLIDASLRIAGTSSAAFL